MARFETGVYNKGFLTDKCGYIRWKIPAREREPLPVTCSRSDTG